MKKRSVITIVLLLLTGCSRTNVPPAPPAGQLPAPGGLAGYQHGRERSRFSPGSNIKRVAEFGFVKEVGNTGTFAIDTVNGSALGIPNASTLAATTSSYGATGDEHNQFVRTYFLAAGIPAEQVVGVHAATLLEATGRVGEGGTGKAQVTAYYSILERAVADVPVVDSIAWARVDGQGNVIAEAVYWPAIPAEVLAQVKQFKEMLAAPEQRKAYEARLPSGAASGRLVIRHASATIDGPFEAFASYDVRVTPVRPAPEQAQAQAGGPRAVQPQATVIHHFDAAGVERQLPQERRNLGHDVPGDKRAAAK
ncbi:MAG: hypothetical protein ACJ74W_17880 [Pyrinomonadaceae bacterium]